jgi:hypothetical protein
VATVGEVLQDRYDPYRIDRARTQEFGDVLAEGTFWLLDQGKTASEGGLAHWKEFLAKRQRFIDQVLVMVRRSTTIESVERAQMIEALKAAQGRRARISPELCVAYLRAWVSDQERWQQHLQSVRPQPDQPREAALKALSRSSGSPLTWCTNERCSVPEPPHRPGKPRTLPTSKLRPLVLSDLQPVIPAPTVDGTRRLTAAAAVKHYSKRLVRGSRSPDRQPAS